MGLADQLTVARALSVPIVVALFAISFANHDYWATGVFCAAMATDWFDGRIARRTGRSSPLGSLLDPVADKLLVMATLIVLLGQNVFPAWMVAAIVARELLISGLRQAAVERGVVMAVANFSSPPEYPNNNASVLFEVFKIQDGLIRHIEAMFRGDSSMKVSTWPDLPQETPSKVN